MEVPERLHNSEPWAWAVGCCGSHPQRWHVVVASLTCTAAEQLRPAECYAEKSGQAKGLTSSECQSFLKAVLVRLGIRHQHYIVHGRDPSHKGVRVQRLIEDAGHRSILLPPRSTDLEPLEYIVFGNAKSWLAREKPPGVGSWGGGGDAFVRHLKDLDPVKQLGAYGMRLEKVLAMKCRHFKGARFELEPQVGFGCRS